MWPLEVTAWCDAAFLAQSRSQPRGLLQPNPNMVFGEIFAAGVSKPTNNRIQPVGNAGRAASMGNKRTLL
jgi:hypothetical protein